MSLEIQSQADDGLLGLVTRAERAVLDSTVDPVGVLGIELADPPPDHPQVMVEAAFVERAGSGIVERLEVHVAGARLERDAMVRLFRGAGGVDYTSVCLRDGEHELVDLTLYYGSRIKLFGRTTALLSDRLGVVEVDKCRHVLEPLGLGELRAAARRFGPPPRTEAQVECVLRARERKLDVELYASTLPLTRSARVAISKDHSFCSLSRQIPREATSIAKDAVALRDLAQAELGVDFGAHRWRVHNAHGEAPEHRAHGPMGDGRRVSWSLNWGAKRR
jgi:hypothetical protein